MSDALPIGQRLKAERERRGMSIQKAADDLRLDSWVIEALEAGDYARIGPTVYAKGYLKKYASILGVPATDVIAGTEPAPAVPPAAVMRVTNAPASAATASAGLIMAAIALLLVASVAALVWWHPWRASAKGGASAGAAGAAGAATLAARAGAARAPRASSTALAVALEQGGEASGSAHPASASQAGTAQSQGSSEQAEAPLAAESGVPREAALQEAAAVQEAAGLREAGSHSKEGGLVQGAALRGASAASVPAGASPSGASGAAPGDERGAGRARLRLSFSADSWVEVHDATGRRVFVGQGRANSVKTLAGVAPLRIYLGYVSGVQLEVNDRAVAIGRQFVTGDVAHFEAGADGVLRRDSGGAVVTPAAPPVPSMSPASGAPPHG